jgi:hypothetical protein
MMKIALYEKLEGWRQGRHLIKKMKKQVRKAGALKYSIRTSSKGATPKDDAKIKQKTKLLEEKQKAIIAIHREINALASKIVEQVQSDLKVCKPHKNVEKVENFLMHTKRQINQIERRVIWGEVIPAVEKVYSVFEPHTEWISKGKAGVPQELGMRVGILEDQHGFILGHVVMEKQTDDQVAVAIVREAKKQFPNLGSCSFDKGFHSPQNQLDLSEALDEVILPKKGKLSVARLEIETSESFVRGRNRHSAVESAINSLEHHGLDRCLDHGIDGFKRYVSLAILSRNIYQLGRLILAKERKIKKASPMRLAA